MLIIYLHTKFQTARSSSSLAIAVKLRAKETFYTDVMFVSYILLKLHKCCIICNLFYVHNFRTLYEVALATHSPHVNARPPCYYYPLQEMKEYEVRVGSNGITFILSMVNIGHLFQKLKSGNT
jgi:hypothetical protein